MEKLDWNLTKKKNTAPGVSGHKNRSHSSITQGTQRNVAQLPIIPYLTDTKYDDWNNEIANWIPKKKETTAYVRDAHSCNAEMCMGIKKGERANR